MLVNPIVRLCVFDDLMILMIHRADNPMTKAATTHKKFVLSCVLILNPLLTKLIYFHLRCHSCFIHLFENMDSSCPYKVKKGIRSSLCAIISGGLTITAILTHLPL